MYLLLTSIGTAVGMGLGAWLMFNGNSYFGFFLFAFSCIVKFRYELKQTK